MTQSCRLSWLAIRMANLRLCGLDLSGPHAAQDRKVSVIVARVRQTTNLCEKCLFAQLLKFRARTPHALVRHAAAHAGTLRQDRIRDMGVSGSGAANGLSAPDRRRRALSARERSGNANGHRTVPEDGDASSPVSSDQHGRPGERRTTPIKLLSGECSAVSDAVLFQVACSRARWVHRIDA